MATKPPIVMVHGAFCGGWAFDDFAGRLQALDFDCLAPTLPGHGPGQSPAGLSMADYARAVVGTAQACATPPVLIGHSLGGLAAAMAAGRTPVSGLILLAPSAPWGHFAETFEEAASAVGVLSLGGFWSGSIPPDFDLASQYGLHEVPPAQRRAVFSRMTPESGRAMFETLNWWLDPFMTTRIDKGAINAPAIAFAGGRDRIHSASAVRRLAEELGAEFQIFGDKGHWLIGEPGFESVADACAAWIAGRTRLAA